jgi:hypothetical protein
VPRKALKTTVAEGPELPEPGVFQDSLRPFNAAVILPAENQLGGSARNHARNPQQILATVRP